MNIQNHDRSIPPESPSKAPVFYVRSNDYIGLAIEVLARDYLGGTAYLGCSDATALSQYLTDIVGWLVVPRCLRQRMDDIEVHHKEDLRQRIDWLQKNEARFACGSYESEK